MTISCRLRLLLARANVERAQRGKPPLSLRRLAGESGVSLSALTALNTGRSQRIDYTTLDNLLSYFSTYFTVTTSDLLVWEQDLEKDSKLVQLDQREKQGHTLFHDMRGKHGSYIKITARDRATA